MTLALQICEYSAITFMFAQYAPVSLTEWPNNTGIPAEQTFHPHRWAGIYVSRSLSCANRADSLCLCTFCTFAIVIFRPWPSTVWVYKVIKACNPFYNNWVIRALVGNASYNHHVRTKCFLGNMLRLERIQIWFRWAAQMFWQCAHVGDCSDLL